MNEINGFKIIEKLDKGYVIAKCKECLKDWRVYIYTLNNKKSCGCNSWSQLKPLPEFINGFKIIKCFGYDKLKGRRALVECKVCKIEYEVDPTKLKYRQHCGCMKKNIIACKYAKSHPQLAQAIKHMLGRCYNENDKDYYNYGAKGITVCDEWRQDRNKFCEWSLANGFRNEELLSIDRIDGSKGYCPDNCRWTNAKEQGRNTRRNVLNMKLAEEIRNSTMSKVELAKKYKVSWSTIWLVINNRIWIK
jgi:hypothetical protein